MKTMTNKKCSVATPNFVRAVFDLQLRYATLMEEEKRDYFGLLNCAGQALALAENLLRQATAPNSREYKTLRPLPTDAKERVRLWTKERTDLLDRRNREDEVVCRMIEGAMSLCESLLPADESQAGSERRNGRGTQ